MGAAAEGNAGGGVRSFAQNLSTEGLVRIAENGRAEPRLAESWHLSPDGLSMELRLRTNVSFQDGSPVTARAVANTLNSELPGFMGPAFEDIKYIRDVDARRIDIGFSRPSPFLQEALEVQIRKRDAQEVGTGPFQVERPGSFSTLRANQRYYLGRPEVDRIEVTNYPSVRAAWADLLRGRIDMLYEVSAEALDSLRGASSVSVFSFTRPYQYVVAFNPRIEKFRAPEVRRALNQAIDRGALIRDGLGGRGSPSNGPIWQQHWALTPDLPKLVFAPAESAEVLRTSNLRFTCLVPSQYERLALLIQQQLNAVGVDMRIEEAPPDRVFQALKDRSFEAVFLDMVSGPSIFRIYEWWHSKGSFNPGSFGNPVMDAALDRIRHAASDDAYRDSVASLQRTIVDNPPAIFIAWSERARAVTRRFKVTAEPDRDILTTLRLWRPTTGVESASRN